MGLPQEDKSAVLRVTQILQNTVLASRATLARARARSHWAAVEKMPVHQEYKRLGCIFVHIPKTGGLAVSRALFGADSQHRTLYQYRLIFGNQFYRQAFKFAIARDPVARFLSAFRFLKTGGINEKDKAIAENYDIARLEPDEFVEQFLKNRELQSYMHFILQSEFVMEHGRLGVDFLGRLENLEQDFNSICDRLGVKAQLQPQNISAIPPKQIALSEDQRRKIEDFYSRDYQLLRHSPS